MIVVRNSKNSRLMIQLDSEEERAVFKRVMDRALNTWEPPDNRLLKVYEDIKRPLDECGTIGHAPTDADQRERIANRTAEGFLGAVQEMQNRTWKYLPVEKVCPCGARHARIGKYCEKCQDELNGNKR